MSEETKISTAISKEAQHQHLIKVSRTFAFTIPFLPPMLADIVSNAYLLCRIADTVEDDPIAPVKKKAAWLKSFGALAGTMFRDPARVLKLQQEAMELVKDGAKADEYELLAHMHRVIDRARGYHREILKIISHGVQILSNGMASSLEGVKIKDLDDVDRYCYSVAGVVGQMLAHLFAVCNHKIDAKELSVLSVSFGEGLQLTNILKDRFSDKEDREASYLPEVNESARREQTLWYAAITQGHLDDAVDFITRIPRLDSGVRLFCLINVIMAMLTLKKIVKNPQGPSSALKISRRCVKISAAACMLVSRSNLGIRLLALISGFGSSRIRRSPKELHDKVSLWDRG